MASLLCRTAAGFARRTTLLSSVRASSHGPTVEPHKGKVASDKAQMPDTLGHSVGAARFEMLANIAGNEDPFEMDIKKRGAGTQVAPTLIPSAFGKRLVGCICEEDSISINWMYINKGEAKRCGCGHWFKMVELKHEDYGQ